MAEISHSVVICTQARSQDFETLMSCLNQIARTVSIQLVVVANSSLLEDNNLVEATLKNYGEFEGKIYLEGPPGLPRSRNLAKPYLLGKYVTFLDDDTEVTSSYFQAIEKLFESDSEIVGAAPYIEVDPLMWNHGTPKRKRLSRCKKSAGNISRSGKFSWIEYAEGYHLVKWLPGCAMSYRWDALQLIDFNLDLENGVTGGYALGEDADFSMRMAKIGKLVGVANEIVFHKTSPVNRASAVQMEIARGSWLAYLTRKFPSQFNSSAVIFRLILNFIAIFLGVRTKSGLSRMSFKNGSLRIKGFVNEKRHPKLTSENLLCK